MCQNCKNPLSERAKFCRMCGTPVVITSSENASNTITKSEVILPTKVLAPSPGVSAKQVVPPIVSTTKAKSISVVQIVEKLSSNLSLAPPTNALVGSLEQAGFLLRMGAFMLDVLLMMVLLLVIAFLANNFMNYQIVISKIAKILFLVLWIGNFFILPSIKGQTLGKWLIGIRIISLNQTRAKTSQIVIRHLFGYPIALIPFALGLLWLIWDPKQQGWHDKLAKTLVIKKRFDWQ
ncbi:MAG: RDD family protein [Acidobacteria bacterium]|nr:RDD family protein [Acidobacteriota bacterium]